MNDIYRKNKKSIILLLTKDFMNKSVTIKAAWITGICVIAAALISGFFIWKGSSNKSSNVNVRSNVQAPITTINKADNITINMNALDTDNEEITKELESKINIFNEYSEVAKLNCIGLPPIRAVEPIKISSAISTILEGTFKYENDVYTFFCDLDNEAKYRKVINEHPKFPFSYCYLANCLRNKNDESWKDYARKGLGILKKTTIIEGHHKNHNEALQKISKLLNE